MVLLLAWHWSMPSFIKIRSKLWQWQGKHGWTARHKQENIRVLGFTKKRTLSLDPKKRVETCLTQIPLLNMPQQLQPLAPGWALRVRFRISPSFPFSPNPCTNDRWLTSRKEAWKQNVKNEITQVSVLQLCFTIFSKRRILRLPRMNVDATKVYCS